MKKELVFGILALLILISFFSFVHAQGTEDLARDAGNISGEIKNKAGEILETEKASQEIQNFAETFFKVDREISFSEFVIMLVLFFFIFMFLSNILPFMPFLNSGAGKWLGALVVSCLISVSGGIYYGAFWLFGLLDSINFLVKLGALRTFVILVFFAVVVLFLIYFLKLFRNKVEKKQAEIEGMEAGFSVKFIKLFKDIFR